jgi:hypothetical protein
MSQTTRPSSPLISQLDITANVVPPSAPVKGGAPSHDIQSHQLLRDILQAMDRQNELMEELIGQVGSMQRQRMTELAQWKEANPRLARNCRTAAEALARVQTEFLASLTSEINSDPEALMDGEFALNEFIDRYGPRMAHLNGVLQVLAQLGSAPNSAT